MTKKPVYTGPVSLTLRRHPDGDKAEIVSTIRWIAIVCSFVFLTLTLIFLRAGYYRSALISASGIVPIPISIILLWQGAVSAPSALLAVTFVLLITGLATFGHGLYDVGVLGYPVILLVAELVLSRVDRLTHPPKEVPFEEILRDALAAAEGLLKSRQVQVECDAIFPFVHVDHVRVVQVLQNLITNAVKFMGDQPQPIIRIGFEEIDGQHIFPVEDNGIGIAPEQHERIFELFHRLNPEIAGTGIGLGLAKRIIQVHNGKIWVESSPGSGSTFKFTLAPAVSRG